MSQIKTITIPWWVLLLIGAIITVLLFKFCGNKKAINSEQIIALQRQHVIDSLQYAARVKAMEYNSQKIKQQLIDSQLLLNKTKQRLANIILENKTLVKKYSNWQHITPIDTSATLVPAEFIKDCKGCFTQLEKITDTAEQYKYQAEQMQVLYISQSQIDSQRIAECDSYRLKLNKQYNDLYISAQAQAKALQPRRKIKIGIAGRFNDKFLPDGVGPGIMYQDRKDRDFGFRPLYGNGRAVYVVDVFIPIFPF